MFSYKDNPIYYKGENRLKNYTLYTLCTFFFIKH